MTSSADVTLMFSELEDESAFVPERLSCRDVFVTVTSLSAAVAELTASTVQ